MTIIEISLILINHSNAWLTVLHVSIQTDDCYGCALNRITVARLLNILICSDKADKTLQEHFALIDREKEPLFTEIDAVVDETLINNAFICNVNYDFRFRYKTLKMIL